jgi:hypothetical protein
MENVLENTGSITEEGSHEMDQDGPRSVRPGWPACPISGPMRAHFDLAASQTIYSPLAKSHASTHSSFATEEQRREGHHSGAERVELVV